MRSTTTRLMDQYKKANGLLSDRHLCRELGIGSGNAARYRHGRTMEEETAVNVCLSLEIDPAPILAELAADRCLSPKVKSVWRRVAGILYRMNAPYKRERRSARTCQYSPGLLAPHPIKHRPTKKARGT